MRYPRPINLHMRLVILPDLAREGSGSNNAISGLIRDPRIIVDKVEEQLCCLLFPLTLNLRHAPDLIIPFIGRHLRQFVLEQM